MISPGDLIRDIRVVEKLGEGGMGEVFLARQEKIGREVAVKVIRADRRLRPSAKTRFLREAHILALCLAAAASTTGFFHARHSQQRAEAARTEAEAVNDFLRTMLASPAPTEHGIDTKVTEVLNEAAQRIDSELADHPEIRATIHATLGETYFALGDWVKAHEQFSEAATLRRAHLGPDHPKTIRTEIEVAVTVVNQGRHEEGIAALEAHYRQCTAIFGPDHPRARRARDDLADVLEAADRVD